MPWVVGIDEAGYGPNLGPLVQAAVCFRLPDDDPAGWETLKSVVRRAHEPADGRLLIDDSKKVYTRGGLAALERVVLPALGLVPQSLAAFTEHCRLLELAADLGQEAWFEPDEQLPVAIDRAEIEPAVGTWLRGMEILQGGSWSWFAAVVPAPRFNRTIDVHGSKGAVLAEGLVSLLPRLRHAGRIAGHVHPDQSLVFHCDKQGGRNYYAALVQQAFPDGWVVAEVESAAESRYRVEQLDRPVTITFRPRADGDSVAVALASMLCKYLREVCMRQFNRFWATHVPGLAPTAGYPVDAKRFYAAIRPAMEKLGLTADQVWRKR